MDEVQVTQFLAHYVFILKYFNLCVYVCISVYKFVSLSAGNLWDQNRASDPLELELLQDAQCG